MEELVGYTNVDVAYLIVMAGASYMLDARCFVLGTSFVHYGRYIHTFYDRSDVASGIFKRDVRLFKYISITQLAYHFMISDRRTSTFTDPTSIVHFFWGVPGGLLVAGLLLYSFMVLCTNHSYVGREHGHRTTGHNLQSFPDGTILFPLTVFQCMVLCGLHLHDGFRQQWPYLVPTHCFFYVLHTLQELFDIRRKTCIMV